MKQARLYFILTFLSVWLMTTSSCPQTTATGDQSVSGVFVASTPCDAAIKKLLGISSGYSCDLMKWVTLYRDPKTSAPSGHKLICVYGLPKQGTKDLMGGATKIEFKGNWTVGKGTFENPKATVYKLNNDNATVSLSFLKADQNILHLLDGDKRLMTGNGAWSYTLNRIDPLTAPPGKAGFQLLSAQLISTDSPVVGIFDGRTPCMSVPRESNGISATGCNATKWRVTLYQDPMTHKPTTFLLHTVYVGKGNDRYTNTGKWKVIRGTNSDPEAIVYQLDLDAANPAASLLLQRADDNILFFLDKDRNFMVGDVDFSYTLNRVRK